MTFAALFVSEKREKKKSFFMFLYGGSKPPPYAQSPSIANIQSEKYILHSVGARAKFPPYKIKPEYIQQTKEKIKVPSAFSFDEEGAKEKATKKKTPKEDFALCGARQRLRVPRLGDADTHASHMCQSP